MNWLLCLVYLAASAFLGVGVASSATCGVGLVAGTDTWCSGLIWLFGAAIAVPVAVVVGFPSYYLFKRFGFTEAWHYAFAGLACSLPLWWALAAPFSSVRWQQSGLFDSLNYIGSGVCAALIFWLLQRHGRSHAV